MLDVPCVRKRGLAVDFAFDVRCERGLAEVLKSEWLVLDSQLRTGPSRKYLPSRGMLHVYSRGLTFGCSVRWHEMVARDLECHCSEGSFCNFRTLSGVLSKVKLELVQNRVGDRRWILEWASSMLSLRPSRPVDFAYSLLGNTLPLCRGAQPTVGFCNSLPKYLTTLGSQPSSTHQGSLKACSTALLETPMVPGYPETQRNDVDWPLSALECVGGTGNCRS